MNYYYGEKKKHEIFFDDFFWLVGEWVSKIITTKLAGDY